jgi:hypothetical protein
MAGAGGIEAVLSAMKRHVDMLVVQERGCYVLWQLSAAKQGCGVTRSSGVAADLSPDVKASIVAAGGIDAIVSAMRRHSDDAAVQEWACRALQRLAARNVANQVAIAAADGVVAVVDAMRRHTAVADVSEWGCAALRSLAYGHEGNQVAIAAVGGIETVASVMQRHADAAGVQQHGLGALRRLSDHAANAKAVADGGHIRVVVTAMAHFVTEVTVQAEGCALLASVSAVDECHAALTDAKAINSVVTAMRKHAASTDVHSSGCRVMAELCIRLRVADPKSWNRFSVRTVLQDAVTAAGGIDAMVQSMQSFPEAVDIQHNCCLAMRALCDGSAGVYQSHAGPIVVAGGIGAVVAATRRAVSVEVAGFGCDVLRNFGLASKSYIDMIAAAGGFAAVVSAMQRYPASTEVQCKGCRVLVDACKSATVPHAAVAIAAAGGVEVVVSAMQRHAESVEVQEHGCEVLSALSKHSPTIATAVAAAGGLDAVVSAMRRHAAASSKLRDNGNGTIENIVGRERAVRARCLARRVAVCVFVIDTSLLCCRLCAAVRRHASSVVSGHRRRRSGPGRSTAGHRQLWWCATARASADVLGVDGHESSDRAGRRDATSPVCKRARGHGRQVPASLNSSSTGDHLVSRNGKDVAFRHDGASLAVLRQNKWPLPCHCQSPLRMSRRSRLSIQ